MNFKDILNNPQDYIPSVLLPNEDTTEYTPSSLYSARTVERLGVKPELETNIIKFADIVADIESNKDTTAKNKRTSATGAFQYVKGSVLPALNRMKRYGELPDWASELKEKYSKGVTKKEHQELISDLTYEQQRDMFLADMGEKTVVKPGYGDTLLKGIALGNTEAIKDLYYKGHHTDPDERTIKRVNQFLD